MAANCSGLPRDSCYNRLKNIKIQPQHALLEPALVRVTSDQRCLLLKLVAANFYTGFVLILEVLEKPWN